MLKHIEKMTVAAHRGDSYNYYENTMTAFEKAIEAGADMIETDVRLSKDNILFLMHDNVVDRTTDGKGRIEDKTSDEIRKINAGDADKFERIPVLEDLMKLAVEKDVMLNIEIKEWYSEQNEEICIRCIEEVVALIDKYDMAQKTVINSFDAWVLEYVYKKYGKKYMLHGFYPYVDNMLNVGEINPDEYLYCACIFDDLNKENYDYLIKKNIEPWIGASVTQKSKLEICAKLGAKLVTTNNPGDALNKLRESGLRN